MMRVGVKPRSCDVIMVVVKVAV